MERKEQPTPPVTMEQVQSLRKKTDKVSEYLYKQTEIYLNALRPALVPHRLLGQYIEHPGKMTVTGADKAWTRLAAAYRQVAARLPISTELPRPLPPIDPILVLYPWEYTHHLQADGNQEVISVASPAKWIVSYRSTLTAVDFRQALASDPERQKGPIQQFVINVLVISEAIRSVPGIQDLFTALRLQLGEEPSQETGALRYSTLTAAVIASLPGDDLVLQTTRASGVNRFTELIDLGSVENLADPVHDHLLKLIK